MWQRPLPRRRPTRRVQRALCAALLGLVAGCVSPDAPIAAPLPTTPESSALPTNWRTSAPEEFERWLGALDRSGADLQLRPDGRRQLEDALVDRPETAARAALILARTDGAGTEEILLRYLERRRRIETRGDDVGERTAAAVLAQRALTPEQCERLWALATTGPDAHPEFAVRVECALALLARADDRALGFLVAAARHDTPAARSRGESLTDSPTTAWPRWRAASALEATLGIEPTYDPDMPALRRGELVDEYARRLVAAGRIAGDS
ncbi:MAG: hypothetical protein GC161_12760 [Planctomycetaceae bacterium]|nr:hypothetical protein [Planctomycetaceae bacterium]